MHYLSFLSFRHFLRISCFHYLQLVDGGIRTHAAARPVMHGGNDLKVVGQTFLEFLNLKPVRRTETAVLLAVRKKDSPLVEHRASIDFEKSALTVHRTTTYNRNLYTQDPE